MLMSSTTEFRPNMIRELQLSSYSRTGSQSFFQLYIFNDENVNTIKM